MIREIMIILYLFFYKIFFSLFKLFPVKNKIVIMASFIANNKYIYHELEKQNYSGDIVILCKKGCYPYFKDNGAKKVYLIEGRKLLDELIGAYHLMTAKKIVVDNYFGLLAAAKFKKEVECIQIWHATGAIKSFGFLDANVHKRNKRELKRIHKVYKNFHKCIIGSPKFGEIFEDAFSMQPSQMLDFGFPRTDFYFHKETQVEMYDEFFEKYPHLKDKKIILYAPTYRPNPNDNKINLDFNELNAKLPVDYVLAIRMHPSVKINAEALKDLGERVYFYTNKTSIQTLMLVSHYLITDYSSIPFEYAFLNKPMIFYAYDLDRYTINPGFWDDYTKIVPSPIVKNSDELLDAILNFPFENVDYDQFRKEWNLYSDGKCSERLVSYLTK